MGEQEIMLLIWIPSIVFVMITSGIIFLLYTYFKTKQKHLIETQQRELAFAFEVQHLQSEIQDHTLQQVGKELHDNIGQLLLVSKIHSQSLLKTNTENKKMEALDIILGNIIDEVKSLSRSLDNNRVSNFGLHHELQLEKERIELTGKLQLQLDLDERMQLPQRDSMILYRIIQEFVSNSMKYSSCKHIHISLLVKQEHLMVRMEDDGCGFDILHVASNGSGLMNMKQRALLIGAENYQFSSFLHSGTQLQFILKQHA